MLTVKEIGNTFLPFRKIDQEDNAFSQSEILFSRQYQRICYCCIGRPHWSLCCGHGLHGMAEETGENRKPV